MVNNIDHDPTPQQNATSDHGLNYLHRPICPNTSDKYGIFCDSVP